MAHYQEGIHKIIVDVADILSHPGAIGVEKLYLDFIDKTWRELPLYDAQGSTLGTVSCMPVWELLHHSTSSFNNNSLSDRAFTTQLLTAMYPKPKDRRSTFQQTDCYTPGQLAAPLSCRAPVAYEGFENILPKWFIEKITSGFQIPSSPNDLGRSIVSHAILVLLREILPNIEVCYSRVSIGGRFLVKYKGEYVTNLHSLSSAIWKYLVLAKHYSVTDSAELELFLTTSKWAGKVVKVDNQQVAYRILFAHMIDAVKILLLTNCGPSYPGSDNLPLIDPRIQLHTSATAQDSLIEENNSLEKPYEKTCVRKIDNLAKDKLNATVDTLEFQIPSQIEFSGSSSTCRDCDQLTYLCRSIIYSPSCSMRAGSTRAACVREMLFNRKRQRYAREGPLFLPASSPVSEMLEKKNCEKNTLERLSSSWAQDQ